MSGNPKYNDLMHEVCVGLGFCGATVNGEPLHVDDFIPESGLVSARQFVEWVFSAEGLDPVTNLSTWNAHNEQLRKAFIRHMGADAVDASELKWEVG